MGLSLSGEGVGAPADADRELSEPVQEIAWKAQVRLCKRYRRMVARGKKPNVVVTAIARETLAFLWAIAREVPISN
jgi:transposase